jgi:hypothetical protein
MRFSLLIFTAILVSAISAIGSTIAPYKEQGSRQRLTLSNEVRQVVNESKEP